MIWRGGKRRENERKEVLGFCLGVFKGEKGKERGKKEMIKWGTFSPKVG